VPEVGAGEVQAADVLPLLDEALVALPRGLLDLAVVVAQTKNRTRPIAAAVPISGPPMRPSSSPSAPAALRVPIGKVNHDSGTPALAMLGRIGLKWTRAATAEKVLAAMARRVTTTYAVNIGNLQSSLESISWRY
jgi:hypothetical protein